MEQINISLMSDGEDKTITKVNLNATFNNREAAIAFHAKVAALCEYANRSGVTTGFQQLLPARMRSAS